MDLTIDTFVKDSPISTPNVNRVYERQLPLGSFPPGAVGITSQPAYEREADRDSDSCQNSPGGTHREMLLPRMRSASMRCMPALAVRGHHVLQSLEEHLPLKQS
jgi:hypothetical protein